MIELLYSNTILVPHHCYLNWVVVLKTGSLRIQCIEVLLMSLLQALLPIFKIFSLTSLFFRTHITKAQSFLLASVVFSLGYS